MLGVIDRTFYKVGMLMKRLNRLESVVHDCAS